MARLIVTFGIVCLFALLPGTEQMPPAQNPEPSKSPKLKRVPVPDEKKRQDYADRCKKQALASRVPFANPPELHSGNGVLQTTLNVTYGYNRIGSDRVYLRSYNGFLVGPTLRVQPTDRLSIRLLNDLPEEPETDGHDINDAPHRANSTNLHTHGLHVSPEENADNPFLEIPPKGRHDYVIRLGAHSSGALVRPHPPGTHWYHPHKHGSAALQLASGMAGALIVEGGLDDVPQIKAARERIFVFQQIPYSDSNPGTMEGPPGFLRIRDWSRITDRYTTINGLLRPVIEMAPKEVERWRFIHAGLSTRLNLAVKSTADEKRVLNLHEIAVDGMATGGIDRQPQVEMTTGGSADVLFKAPDEPGEYLLVKLADNLVRLTSDRSEMTGTPEEALARIVVRGPANPMELPEAKALANLAPYRPIDSVQKHRTLTFGGEGGDNGRWTVNDKVFDPDNNELMPVLGAAEEWTIISKNQAHPFHIHVNAFQVLSDKDKNGVEQLKTPGIWRDTYLLNDRHTIRVRMRFEDFPGKTVLHCHKLDHEDTGMMKVVRILPELPDAEAPAKGKAEKMTDNGPAPPWKMPDVAGETHQLRDFAGKRLVMVFFRGIGCLHCVEQLRELSSRRKALEAAGVVVVAVSSDPLPEGSKASDWPFLVLADGDHRVFRQYECYRNRPMHGVFAIDGQGRIRWQNVSDAPYADTDRIIEIGGRLATK